MEEAAGRGCWWELGPGKKGAFESWPGPLVPSLLLPTLPILGALEPGSRASPAWPRSLRMPRGKSTRPTSRHRAPRP